MSASDYLEDKILRWLGHSTAMPAAPGTLYISLHTADPGDTGGSEVSTTGTAYARKAVTAVSGWTTPAGTGVNEISNVSAITWAVATASWGTVTHVGIYDASTAGNLLFSEPLTTSMSIASGETASFAAAQLKIRIS